MSRKLNTTTKFAMEAPLRQTSLFDFTTIDMDDHEFQQVVIHYNQRHNNVIQKCTKSKDKNQTIWFNPYVGDEDRNDNQRNRNISAYLKKKFLERRPNVNMSVFVRPIEQYDPSRSGNVGGNQFGALAGGKSRDKPINEISVRPPDISDRPILNVGNFGKNMQIQQQPSRQQHNRQNQQQQSLQESYREDYESVIQFPPCSHNGQCQDQQCQMQIRMQAFVLLQQQKQKNIEEIKAPPPSNQKQKNSIDKSQLINNQSEFDVPDENENLSQQDNQFSENEDDDPLSKNNQQIPQQQQHPPPKQKIKKFSSKQVLDSISEQLSNQQLSGDELDQDDPLNRKNSSDSSEMRQKLIDGLNKLTLNKKQQKIQSKDPMQFLNRQLNQNPQRTEIALPNQVSIENFIASCDTILTQLQDDELTSILKKLDNLATINESGSNGYSYPGFLITLQQNKEQNLLWDYDIHGSKTWNLITLHSFMGFLQKHFVDNKYFPDENKKQTFVPILLLGVHDIGDLKLRKHHHVALVLFNCKAQTSAKGKIASIMGKEIINYYKSVKGIAPFYEKQQQLQQQGSRSRIVLPGGILDVRAYPNTKTAIDYVREKIENQRSLLQAYQSGSFDEQDEIPKIPEYPRLITLPSNYSKVPDPSKQKQKQQRNLNESRISQSITMDMEENDENDENQDEKSSTNNPHFPVNVASNHGILNPKKRKVIDLSRYAATASSTTNYLNSNEFCNDLASGIITTDMLPSNVLARYGEQIQKYIENTRPPQFVSVIQYLTEQHLDDEDFRRELIAGDGGTNQRALEAVRIWRDFFKSYPTILDWLKAVVIPPSALRRSLVNNQRPKNVLCLNGRTSIGKTFIIDMIIGKMQYLSMPTGGGFAGTKEGHRPQERYQQFFQFLRNDEGRFTSNSLDADNLKRMFDGMVDIWLKYGSIRHGKYPWNIVLALNQTKDSMVKAMTTAWTDPLVVDSVLSRMVVIDFPQQNGVLVIEQFPFHDQELDEKAVHLLFWAIVIEEYGVGKEWFNYVPPKPELSFDERIKQKILLKKQQVESASLNQIFSPDQQFDNDQDEKNSIVSSSEVIQEKKITKKSNEISDDFDDIKSISNQSIVMVKKQKIVLVGNIGGNIEFNEISDKRKNSDFIEQEIFDDSQSEIIQEEQEEEKKSEQKSQQSNQLKKSVTRTSSNSIPRKNYKNLKKKEQCISSSNCDDEVMSQSRERKKSNNYNLDYVYETNDESSTII